MSLSALMIEAEQAGAVPLAWVDVGAVDEVPAQGARRVQTAIGDVAVFKTSDGALYALVDRCPHKQGPLSAGIVHGHAVACPLHNWNIDLATGEPMGPDAGKSCTPTVPLEVSEGRIRLALAR